MRFAALQSALDPFGIAAAAGLPRLRDVGVQRGNDVLAARVLRERETRLLGGPLQLRSGEVLLGQRVAGRTLPLRARQSILDPVHRGPPPPAAGASRITRLIRPETSLA